MTNFPPERIAKIRSLSLPKKGLWWDKFEKAQAYVAKHGNCYFPEGHEFYTWAASTRRSWATANLDQDQLAALKEIKFTKEPLSKRELEKQTKMMELLALEDLAKSETLTPDQAKTAYMLRKELQSLHERRGLNMAEARKLQF